MIEPPEVFVFGPYITNMFGKARHGHAEVRVRALRPRLAQLAGRRADDAHREHEVVGLEAGAPDDAVDLVQRPSAVTRPCGVTRSIASVTSSTFGRCSAGR